MDTLGLQFGVFARDQNFQLQISLVLFLLLDFFLLGLFFGLENVVDFLLDLPVLQHAISQRSHETFPHLLPLLYRLPCELNLGFGLLVIEEIFHLVLLSLADDVAVGALGLVADISQLFEFELLPLVHDLELTIDDPDVLQFFETLIFLNRVFAHFLTVAHRDFGEILLGDQSLLGYVDQFLLQVVEGQLLVARALEVYQGRSEAWPFFLKYHDLMFVDILTTFVENVGHLDLLGAWAFR